MAVPTKLFRAAILTGYGDVANSLGLDARRLLRRFGLHGLDLDDANLLIPASSVVELLEHSATAAGVDDFGLRMAAKRSLAHLGPIGLVAREEPTLRQAIKLFERHFRLHSETLILHLEDHGDVASLGVQLMLTTEGRVRQVAETIVGTVFRTVSALAGNSWTPEAVSFSHPPPRGHTIHGSFFKTRPLFDNAFDGLVIRRDDLSAPIPAADPEMARYIRQYLDGVIAQPIVMIDATVRQLVFALLPSGRCTGDLLVRHLGINRRTLTRRLAARGKSVSSIINDVRIELVRRHIKTECRSLTETAQLLGFSGLPTFSRWFQQQFGVSATVWRKRVT
ncbi:AraC family transcriptional regulator [Bradyrhizobium elkanii]|uniref:AraC family transcriptional regulator n=1 Tax=Bradyrhizobium elkanii TaxID=29448 RepID=UPI001BAB7BD1|nr:AraC family transcriptional regulator [Bradyrhizobium elkanii]MBR1159467.1 AraC family transcriptional regulator [Bradyrhizobium elkanii]